MNMTDAAVSRRALVGAAAGIGALGAASSTRAQEATPVPPGSPAATPVADGQLAATRPLGELELVAAFTGPMPTGVTIAQSGRIFINYPKWGDDVTFTVAEVIDGVPQAFPDQALNDESDDEASVLVSVQSVVVDPLDRLWLLDTGSPMFRPTNEGGPKLVGVDLATDQVIQTIIFPREVALATTYLNDIRFDLRRGEAGMAFITDSSDTGANGIIVVDLATGESWRQLSDHPSTKAEGPETFQPFVEGRPHLRRNPDGSTAPIGTGSDGIAIGADGDRLYYCPLASRQLYSVSVDALVDRSLTAAEVEATVRDEGDRGGGADGLESDAAGNVYLTNYEHNAIVRRAPSGTLETIVHDPRLLWPDTMSVASDGYLYVTANQLHRQPDFQSGEDLRQQPYPLFRVRIDQQPVRLV